MVKIDLKPECINCRNNELEIDSAFNEKRGKVNVVRCAYDCVCKEYLDSKRKPITDAGLMMICGKAIGNYGEMCHEKV